MMAVVDRPVLNVRRHAMNLRRKWGHFSALTRAEARLFLRA
jgi:hypothetical protein